MINKILNLFSSLYYSRLISDVRLNLFVFWHTKSKIPLLVFTSLFLIGGLVGLGINSIINNAGYNKDVTCLALNIYHEARGEPRAGQHAVADVTLNRASSKHYPNEVCEVVFQKNWDKKRRRYVGAFSWTELDSRSDKNSKEWKQALQIATLAYNGKSESRAKDALFYHANYVKPRWAKHKKPVARIGKHIFYN